MTKELLQKCAFVWNEYFETLGYVLAGDCRWRQRTDFGWIGVSLATVRFPGSLSVILHGAFRNDVVMRHLEGPVKRRAKWGAATLGKMLGDKHKRTSYEVDPRNLEAVRHFAVEAYESSGRDFLRIAPDLSAISKYCLEQHEYIAGIAATVAIGDVGLAKAWVAKCDCAVVSGVLSRPIDYEKLRRNIASVIDIGDPPSISL